MQFDHSFEVASPVDAVWAALLDPERLASCLPGARVIERTGEHAYRVALKVRLGSGSASFEGDLAVLDPDPETHVASLQFRTREARGPGTANADVVVRLAEHAGGTEGKVFTQLALSGRAASMGPGPVGDASGRLIDAFASNLAAELGDGGAGPAARPSPAVPRARAAAVPERAQERDPAPAPAAQPTPGPEPEPEVEPAPVPEARPKPQPRSTPAPAPERPSAAREGGGATTALRRLGEPRTLGAAAAAMALLALLVGWARAGR